MPDLAAGTTVLGEDTPPPDHDSQTGQYTFNATTYGIDVDSGTYVDCAVVFTAGTTGRAKITYQAQLDNDTAAAGTSITPEVREGAVVGSGATVVAAADLNRLLNIGTDAGAFGGFLFVDGLTPGDLYNVRLLHKVSAGIGTILNRRLLAEPCT